MTLLALWEAFQLPAFPAWLWLQPHKGLVSPYHQGPLLAEQSCISCLPARPRSRSAPVRFREEFNTFGKLGC